jgi:hypothetical protein
MFRGKLLPPFLRNEKIKQEDSPKRWKIVTTLKNLTSQKTVNFIAMAVRISNLAFFFSILYY